MAQRVPVFVSLYLIKLLVDLGQWLHLAGHRVSVWPPCGLSLGVVHSEFCTACNEVCFYCNISQSGCCVALKWNVSSNSVILGSWILCHVWIRSLNKVKSLCKIKHRAMAYWGVKVCCMES